MLATLLVALLIASSGVAPAASIEARWAPASVVDGIRAWSAEIDGQYWGYARGRVLAAPDTIFRRIGDFESLPKMYPRLDRVRVIERGADTALVYFHYDLPWPLSDRSYTARHHWWTEPSGAIVLDVEDANDTVPPADDGAVQVRGMLARIVMAPALDGSASDVEYLFRADVAGFLPHSVRLQTAWKVPLNVVLSMRRSLEPTRSTVRVGERPRG